MKTKNHDALVNNKTVVCWSSHSPGFRILRCDSADTPSGFYFFENSITEFLSLRVQSNGIIESRDATCPSSSTSESTGNQLLDIFFSIVSIEFFLSGVNLLLHLRS